MPTLFSQAQALTTLGTTPLVVLTASESLQTINGWSTAQDRMTALSANSGHQVAHTAHAALLGEEHGAEAFRTGHRRRRTGRAHRCTAPDKMTAGPMTATGVARGCRVRRVGNVKTSKVQGVRQGVVPAWWMRRAGGEIQPWGFRGGGPRGEEIRRPRTTAMCRAM